MSVYQYKKKGVTVLTVFIVIATTIIVSIILVAIRNTKNIKVPYYIHCYKSYYTNGKCWILYLYLKQQAKAGGEYHKLFSKKRKTYKNNNKLDNLIGLIIHFKITVKNNTGNLLHT